MYLRWEWHSWGRGWAVGGKRGDVGDRKEGRRDREWNGWVTAILSFTETGSKLGIGLDKLQESGNRRRRNETSRKLRGREGNGDSLWGNRWRRVLWWGPCSFRIRFLLLNFQNESFITAPWQRRAVFL